jgi:virulence-associated protein VagC
MVGEGLADWTISPRSMDRVQWNEWLEEQGCSRAVEARRFACPGDPFEGQDEVVIYRESERVILEPARRQWSEEFLRLAGSGPDFPYPEEPPPAEPGPDLD